LHEGGTIPDAAPGSRRGALYRAAEIAAWGAGLLLLAMYGGSRIRQMVTATREVREFGRVKTLSWHPPDQSLWAPERIRAWERETAAAGRAGAAIAILRIPRIGLEVPILEGTDDATLDRGAGHIEGTSSPGAPGNMGIAGHRDGFFRTLKDVVLGDGIELETRTKTYQFVVDGLSLVGPDDTWVLDPTPSRQISLVTCFPFYYTGAAPLRYIVRAVENGPPR
jgi:sortase A